MRARTTRGLAAFVTTAALVISFPVAGLANKGGVPNSHSVTAHSKKACPHRGKGAKKKARNKHGKKCGFNKS